MNRAKDVATLKRELEFGRIAEPCDCGGESCTGWTFGGLIGHGNGRPVGILTNPDLRFGRNLRP